MGAGVGVGVAMGSPEMVMIQVACAPLLLLSAALAVTVTVPAFIALTAPLVRMMDAPSLDSQLQMMPLLEAFVGRTDAVIRMVSPVFIEALLGARATEATGVPTTMVQLAEIEALSLQVAVITQLPSFTAVT